MLLVASAVAIALQLETGIAAMHRQADDTYVEYGLPGKPYSFDYHTVAFGAGIKLDARRMQLTIGWRNLGNEHLSAWCIADYDYWRYMNHEDKTPNNRFRKLWVSAGNVQQVYTELGYKISVGSWYIVPSAGIADNRIQWHTTRLPKDGNSDYDSQSKTEHRIAPFVGLSLAKGQWSGGVFYLDTKPNTSLANDPAYPGQGPNVIYGRITYAIN